MFYMESRNRSIEMRYLRAYIIDMTLKGIKLANKQRPKGMWFPKSTILNSYSQEPLMFQDFLIEDWILEKKRQKIIKK